MKKITLALFLITSPPYISAQNASTATRRYTIRDVMKMDDRSSKEDRPWILRTGEWIGAVALTSLFFWAPNWFVRGRFDSDGAKVTLKAHSGSSTHFSAPRPTKR